MKRTIAIELDETTADRLERAARFRDQSPIAFAAQASAAAAHQALLDEAVARYQQDAEAQTVSELAAENGLAIEELVMAIQDRLAALVAETGLPAEQIVSGWYHSDPTAVEEAFLAASQTIASDLGDPQFLERARAAVAARRQQRAQDGAATE